MYSLELASMQSKTITISFVIYVAHSALNVSVIMRFRNAIYYYYLKSIYFSYSCKAKD